MEEIGKHTRVIGERRDEVRAELVARYQEGASIRSLAAEFGRSYGFVHRMLREAPITLRPRGGSRVTK